MNKLIAGSILSISIALAWTLVGDHNPAEANNGIAGCCKTRATDTSPWGKIGTDLNHCKDLNRDDNDNVFKKSGKVWWDVAC